MKQSHTKQSRATQDPFCKGQHSLIPFISSFRSFYYIYTPLFAIKYTYMLPETLCTSPTSAHLRIHREHNSSQRDLGEFRASRKCPGSFPERRFGVCADPPSTGTLLQINIDCDMSTPEYWSEISRISPTSCSQVICPRTIGAERSLDSESPGRGRR